MPSTRALSRPKIPVRADGVSQRRRDRVRGRASVVMPDWHWDGWSDILLLPLFTSCRLQRTGEPLTLPLLGDPACEFLAASAWKGSLSTGLLAACHFTSLAGARIEQHRTEELLFLAISRTYRSTRCHRTVGLAVSLTTVSKQPLLLKAFLRARLSLSVCLPLKSPPFIQSGSFAAPPSLAGSLV